MHNRRKKQEIKSSNGKGNSYKKECEQKQEKVMENVNSIEKRFVKFSWKWVIYQPQ